MRAFFEPPLFFFSRKPYFCIGLQKKDTLQKQGISLIGKKDYQQLQTN
jgi:uroporphyrinogen-III synthase